MRPRLQIDFGVKLDDGREGADGTITFGERFLGFRLSQLDSHALSWIFTILSEWQVPEIFLAAVRFWGIKNLTPHRIKEGAGEAGFEPLSDWIRERRTGWTDAIDLEVHQDLGNWFEALSEPKPPETVEFSDGFVVEEKR